MKIKELMEIFDEKKEIEFINKYIFDYFFERWKGIELFCQDCIMNKKQFYCLEKGDEILQLIIDIKCNIEENLYSEKDVWYYYSDAVGILTAKDNFDEYTFDVVFGVNALIEQSKLRGQLEFVSFEAEPTYEDVLVGYDFDSSLTRQATGNLSVLLITVTEKWERHWSNGDVEELDDVIISGSWEVPNNVNANFAVGVYTFAVVISGGGNSEFTVIDIT